MFLWEGGCEKGLNQDHVHWWALLSQLLNLQVLLPQCYLLTYLLTYLLACLLACLLA